MLTCERFEAQLDDRVSGEMDPRAKLSFAVHWLLCHACRLSLATYRRTVALARSTFDDDDPPAPARASRKGPGWIVNFSPIGEKLTIQPGPFLDAQRKSGP